jgi:hypothetical protein
MRAAAHCQLGQSAAAASAMHTHAGQVLIHAALRIAAGVRYIVKARISLTSSSAAQRHNACGQQRY